MAEFRDHPARGDRHSRHSRYGRYDGGPDPLAPPIDLAEALDAIGQDVMAGYSPEHAMREFLRRGGRQQQGLDDLAGRVAQKRRELLQRNQLGGTLQEVRELLDEAVLAERKQLARDLDDEARFAELQIENLPTSTAAAVASLSDYQWRSSQAREAFEQIKDLLGREQLDQRFAGMKQALANATDEDRAAVTAMVADLNDLLEAHKRGEDTAARFADFMAEHGDFFPENPRSVEELIDSLAARSAAAQRMRNSMTQQQRDELDALAGQAFGSPELVGSLTQLDANLRAARPGLDWSSSEQFGEGTGEGLGLGDGTGLLQDIAELDALADQLAQSYPGARLDDIDVDSLARQLGDDAAVSARTIADLEKALRDNNFLRRGTDGSLRLSPKAMRQLGKSLLRDVAGRLSGRQGARDLRQAGAAGERSGATREWQFGDTQPWDLPRTITNSLVRRAADGRPGAPTDAGPKARSGSGQFGRMPVRLDIRDIEIQETESRTQAAVALLVDTSFSMAMDGRWVPMKRTALALHQLISSRFRGDDLQLIAFGRNAQVIGIEELTGLEAYWDKGTNLHHALLLANRHFRKHPNAQPVLLVVTDGEPTSHLEPDGEVFFSYPPHPVTLARTIRELDATGRLGAQVTFFRLGEDPGLGRFIDALARRVEGRVVSPELDDLGAAVVGSYLGSRRGGHRSGGGPGRWSGGWSGGWSGNDSDWFGGRSFWVDR